MSTFPQKFADAESCLVLTARALHLNDNDTHFLRCAMKQYAALRIEEYMEKDDQPENELVADGGQFGLGA